MADKKIVDTCPECGAENVVVTYREEVGGEGIVKVPPVKAAEPAPEGCEWHTELAD